jgi:methionyl-tRNA synthetase
MEKNFYITTTLPYVNADPHVGFAMEIIRADAVARYKVLQGFEVFFNTGTDEHGSKLYAAAQKEGIPVQQYVDRYAEKFYGLVNLLHISDSVHFIRTTNEHHVRAAQAFWQKVNDNGYIYKKNYTTKYCVGCELEKTDSEVDENDCCLIHHTPVEYIEEENYFFAYSKLTDKLQNFYDTHPNFVIPEFRYNEMKTFLKKGLQDFSISRVKEKMPWGVPVPGDDTQVIYVWFDALVNYISTLGWPEDKAGDFKKFWVNGTPVQYCGKDNTRQQSSMWQAMLMAADLPNTEHIVVNGFINAGGGIKMSKSLGNVINPYDVVERFEPVAGNLSADVLRYFLLRHMNSFEDSDVTNELIAESYTANLANGLGNLVSRIMKMVVSYEVDYMLPTNDDLSEFDDAVPEDFHTKLDSFDLKAGMDDIWREVNSLDWLIQNKEPFKVAKTDLAEAQRIVGDLAIRLYIIGFLLQPFMPATAATILDLVKNKKTPEKPLFARLEK